MRFDLNALLRDAASKGASDIHFAVGASPAYRINGDLVKTAFPEMTPGDTLEVLLNIMAPDQREIFEKNSVIDTSVTIENVGRVRVNAYKQRGFITVTMRLVDGDIPDPESLGIPFRAIKVCEEKRGLVLVTGPAGSGKTTVIASFIERINRTRSCNIITIEDPVEYLHENRESIVNQREIGIDTVDKVSALNSALRQDPDVIAAGEVRNGEEASLVLTCAETGRLVFSSLFTMSAADTLESFLSMFPEQKIRQTQRRLANMLRAIISRQLLRSGDGSLIPAYEILIIDNEIRRMIRENHIPEITEYMKNNPDKGLITMDESLYGLYQNSSVSPEEVLQASIDREKMSERISPSGV